MLRNRLLTLLFVVGVFSTSTFADEPSLPANETKVKIEGVTGQKNKVDGDLDTEITNPKLRADSGSKSKISMSSVLSYTGGPISRPLAAERPNLSDLPENQVDSSVGGTLKLRYRSSKNSSFTAGVGLSLLTPFEGRVNGSANQFNVGDPVLAYNYTFARFGLQNSLDLLTSLSTSNESLRVDQVAGPAVAYTVMKAYQNGFHVGLQATSWYNFFDNKPGDNPLWALSGARPDSRTSWVFYVTPTIEYYINDVFSVRTLFGFFRWRHLYGDPDNSSLLHVKNYQSIGVGVAVTRDVFVYPNVQFLPEDVRSEYTNFGISTSVNIF